MSMDKGYGTTRGEMYENTPDKLFLYGNLHVGEYKGFIKCFFLCNATTMVKFVTANYFATGS